MYVCIIFVKPMHRECLLGLGEALMAEASLILDKNEPEEAEVHLVVVVALMYCTAITVLMCDARVLGQLLLCIACLINHSL